MHLPGGWLVEADKRLRHRLSSLAYALLLVCLLGFAWQTRSTMIRASVPYCHGTDEAHWTRAAINILRTGNWNPRRFTKPSVQVYLATAGMALGTLRPAPPGQTLASPRQLKGDAYPYYKHTLPIQTARELFAAISVGALAIGAFLIQRLYASRIATALALALTLASPYYFWMSWSYINADIIGVFFAVATIAFLVTKVSTVRSYPFAAIAGILCGLTVGCKYNLFPILVPATLALFLFHRAQWFKATLLLGVCSVITFFATTPYALLDNAAFMHSLKAEAAHYASGHPGRTVDAGLPMFLAYTRDFVGQMGWGAVALGGVGAIALVRRDPRRAALLLIYPILLLFYMSSQRTFFERNLLLWYLLIPLLAGIGVVFTFERCSQLLERYSKQLSAPVALRALALVVPCVLLGVGMPWASIARAYDASVESRNEAAQWLKTSVAAKSLLLVPKQLAFDSRQLRKRLTVEAFDAKDATIDELRAKHPGALVLVPSFVNGDEYLDLTDVTAERHLAEFGFNPIQTRYVRAHRRHIFAPKGNPRFVVIQL